MSQCSIDGCTGVVYSWGWCNAHYRQWRRWGDPLIKVYRSKGEFSPEWFWSKVDRSGGPDACWPWTMARLPRGYGVLAYQQRQTYSHRVAYLLDSGFIPDNVPFVCHTCDNPPCCNPDHLWLGTHADNMADMVAKGRERHRNALGQFI